MADCHRRCDARGMGKRRDGVEWRGEVEGWRVSGQDAAAYVKERGYSASSLRRWDAQIPRKRASSSGFVQLQVMGAAPRTERSELVVAVGRAEIRVGRGFDEELLGRVVETLSRGGR